jgi:hypothetical protein
LDVKLTADKSIRSYAFKYLQFKKRVRFMFALIQGFSSSC